MQGEAVKPAARRTVVMTATPEQIRGLLEIADGDAISVGDRTEPIPNLMKHWIRLACAPHVEVREGSGPGIVRVRLEKEGEVMDAVVCHWHAARMPPFVLYNGHAYELGEPVEDAQGVRLKYAWAGEFAQLWGQEFALRRAVDYLETANRILAEEDISDEDDFEDACQVVEAARQVVGTNVSEDEERE